MTTIFVRSTLNKSASISNLLGKQIPRFRPRQCITPIQVATLKATYGEPYGYEKPWPYKEKRLNMLTEWIEGTKKRLNENSKIILVDGNVAVGKNNFAEHLANNFDMRLYPSVKPDNVYKNLHTSFDERNLNDLLPESCRFYDLNDFYSTKDPKNGRIGKMLIYWYMKQILNYYTACLHLLSTGQGVVIVSSCWSQIVYIEALKEMGYITPKFYKWMKDFYDDTICEPPQPHVAIYLNAPIPTIRERINKRNDPKEVNSPILSDEYLASLDKYYRTKYLNKMRITGEVVEIDWTQIGDDLDHATIAEEMESLVLENEDNEDPKFREWRHYTEDDLAWMRRTFDKPGALNQLFMCELPVDCPEIMVDDEDAIQWQTRYFKNPAVKWVPGYATAKNPMFKEMF